MKGDIGKNVKVYEGENLLLLLSWIKSEGKMGKKNLKKGTSKKMKNRESERKYKKIIINK